MRPKISICIPFYNMENADFHMRRLLDSIYYQTFRDFEIIITTDGKMAENTNSAIRKATGELIKPMFMDDFFKESDSLEKMYESFDEGWLATACDHYEKGKEFFSVHIPSYNQDILSGANTIGSPSVVMFENDGDSFFDEGMSWLLDCDLYHRLYEKYGDPTIIAEPLVTIGIGNHQHTHKMSDKEKLDEHYYLRRKYE